MQLMKQNNINLRWDILDKKRLSLLPKLKFLKKQGFYLAGGTALALQIGHRVSVDFDFYNPAAFDSEKILAEFQENSAKTTLIQKAKNTLIAKIEGIDISLFTYQYKLLHPLVITGSFNLASLEDIAAMKLIAIIQRGVRRDFIDLYFLIKLLGLNKVFQLTQKKYHPFNKYLGLQALTYFTDAEKTPEKRKLILLQPAEWKEIKKFIISEAKKIKKSIEK